MIAWLKGVLSDIQRDYVVLDVQGVGYQVFVSPSYLTQLPPQGSEIEMVIYTDVRETDIMLYGFSNTIDRKIFLFLKKVKGIGSRLAISILSGIESKRLLYAIATSDAAVLTKIPGIGKKSAERIILELKEQVQSFVQECSLSESIVIEHDGDKSFSRGQAAASNQQVIDDASMALISLGFSEDAVSRALNSVLDLSSSGTLDDDAGEIVKKALSFIM